jgi:multidrug efflux pump subunit AcrA (membrane-fusion protein)
VAPVQVAVATKRPIPRTIAGSGILWPKDQAAIAPKISAPVKKFYVNRGDRVRSGELLAVLENRDLEAAVSENQSLVEQADSAYRNTATGSLPQEVAKAQSDVHAAREALDAARKLYESRQALLKQGALARRQVDEANVAFTQAQSQYDIALKQLQTIQNVGQQEQIRAAKAQQEAARARYNAAKAQLSYSEIRSPISGVVADRPLYEGEMASGGAALITVMDTSSVIAKVNLTQDQASYLKIGDPAEILSPEGSSAAKVTVISPAVNANSTTVEIWAEAPNPRSLLKPGANVRVIFQAGSVPDALVVPESALLSSKEGELTVLLAGTDGVAHERQVETGIHANGEVQILSGIKPGEQVVTRGGVGLEDGAKIRVTADAPKADGKE